MRPVLFDINAARSTAPCGSSARRSRCASSCWASLPLINVITGVTVAALTADGGGVQALSLDVLIALDGRLLISFELTVLLSRSILRPIEDLEAATERIRQGDFDEHVPVTTADEFGELSRPSTRWSTGCASASGSARRSAPTSTRRSPSTSSATDYDPEGHEVEVSILFCDVKDFTELRGNASAARGRRRLNELFEVVVPIIGRQRGHVDKFIGDGLMAVFGAPEPFPDHADRAVQCAVEIARTRQQPPARRAFEIGVGVNSGPRRRRLDRRRRPAQLQRHRRRRQRRLPGRGGDPRDRRRRADHRGDARAAARDDRGRTRAASWSCAASSEPVELYAR